MKLKEFTLIALMSAVLVVLGMLPPIPLGFTPIPIVLQNMGVMLVSQLLKPKKAIICLLLLLVLGLVFPVFSGGHMTLEKLTGPSAGYIGTWLLVPGTLALLRTILPGSTFSLSFIRLWLAGVFLVDILGGLYLAAYNNSSLYQGLVLSNLAFLPLDTLKALLANLLAQRLEPRIYASKID